jgi:hypothetical protein
MKYLLLALFLIIAACSSGNYFTDRGEELYSEKCAGCHRLYPKKEYTAEEWRLHLEEMSKRAKLSPEEKILIGGYLY